MKRSPLRRGSSGLKRSPLRRISKAKRGQARRWALTRAVVIARDETCRAALSMPDIRCDAGEEVHHIRRRSQGGTDDPYNLILLCTSHHRAVHEQPARAHSLGLLEMRRSA